MLKIILKNKRYIQENIEGLDESRKDDATNFVKKISPEDTAKKEKYETALSAMLANPIADNKYILWMLKHLEEAPDADAMMLAVSYYDMFQKNIEDGNRLKDINNIKSFEELTDVVDDYSKSIKELEREGQKIVVSKEETGGKFEVIRPLNVYASCELGKNSRWCIAATKSKNYFRRYSSQGVVFYTIIDHSKPVKNKDSMFTYALIQKKKDDSVLTYGIEQSSDKVEIYNAVDTLISREEVKGLIGSDMEQEFYTKMREESGLGIESTVEEKYNTFFPRLMKWVRTLGKYDSPYAKLSEKDKEGYEEIESEIRDYFDYWRKIAIGGKLKKAIRHLVGFTQKVSETDNVQLKYRTALTIKYDFPEVSELVSFVPDLMRNPNWLKDADKKFKFLYNMNPLHSALFDTSEDGDDRQPEQKLTEFTEQAIFNDKPEYIQKLFNKFIDAQNKVGEKELDRRTVSERVDAVLKPCVFNMYPPAGEMLKIAVDSSVNPSPMRKLEDIFYSEYGIANFPNRLKLYGNDLIKHCIEKHGSDRKKNQYLTSIIMKTRDLDPEFYKYALDSNENPELPFWFAMHNDINALDLPYQEKVADGVRKYSRMMSGKSSVDGLMSSAYYGLLKSTSFSKEQLSNFLTVLFRSWVIPQNWKKELYDRFGEDPEIRSPIFKKSYEAQKEIFETRLFRLNKEYGVYKVIL